MRVYQRILFSAIYTLLYFASALDAIGAEGKGSSIFFAPFTTWILILIGILLLSPTLSQFRRVFILVMIGIHYFITGLSILQTASNDDGHIAHSWEMWPWTLVFAIAWYAVGQLTIWFFILKGWQSKPQMP